MLSFIQVLSCPPCIGYPQHPGALSTKIKGGQGHRPWCCLQPQPPCVRLIPWSGAFNHGPLTQPSARNEYNDISDSPRTHLGGLWRFKMSPYADLMLLPPATLRFLRLWPVYFFRDSGTGWVSSWYLVVPAYCESHLPRNPSREDGKRWAPPRCDS